LRAAPLNAKLHEMRVPAVAVLVCLLGGGTAAAREHHEHHDGRYHLEKANELAGDGKCAAAVKEFSAAYDKLHDPVVLFNRAECYRRLGENAKAAEDYRAFLDGFPAAPNRAEIEARIATLERPAAPPPPPRGARTPAPPQPVARAPARTPSPVAHAVEPPPVPAAPAEPMPFLPPPPEGGNAKTLVEAPHAAPSDAHAESSHGSRWWLWTALAVVAVGGGVAGYILLRPKDQPLPPVDLGNYRF
jgi:hypothetical protein